MLLLGFGVGKRRRRWFRGLFFLRLLFGVSGCLGDGGRSGAVVGSVFSLALRWWGC